MRPKLLAGAALILLALSCHSPSSKTGATPPQPAAGGVGGGSNAKVFVLKDACDARTAAEKKGPLEISRKEMEVYREAAVAFAGGMGCPCKLSLCINGYVPTYEVLSFINAVHQQVTWVRPDKAHPDDVALGPVMWEDPSRAFVQVRSDHEIRMIIVVVYKPAPED